MKHFKDGALVRIFHHAGTWKVLGKMPFKSGFVKPGLLGLYYVIDINNGTTDYVSAKDIVEFV